MMKTRKSAVLGGIFTDPAVFGRVIMKKKPFLLVLPACLVFCLLLASCDNGYKTESVPGLWEKIRNTAWTTMERTVKDGGEEFHVTYTIGFYGSRNGPYPYNHEETPYAVIRVVLNDAPDGWLTGHYLISSLHPLKISRTGDKIYFDERSSFNINVSENTLSISGMNMSRPFLDGRCRVDQDNLLVTWGGIPWEEWTYVERIDNRIKGQMSGKYSKYSSDPNFAFDEGREKTWPQIKNTAWTKQGSSGYKVGFYEGGKGPAGDHGDYVYFMTPDSSAYFPILGGNDEGIWFRVGVVVSVDANGNANGWEGRLGFKITEPNNGNTLSISNIRISPEWQEDLRRFKEGTVSFSSAEYNTEELGGYFNGTYTKTSSDPDYSWD